jgi:hypothetical protein
MQNLKTIKQKILTLYKKYRPKTKRQMIVAGSISLLVIIIVGVSIYKEYKYRQLRRAVYEVAVMVRDQNTSGGKDAERSALKAGDVVVVDNPGHGWSDSERVSYLILKMKLTDEEKSNLTKAKTRPSSAKAMEGKGKDLSKDMGRRSDSASSPRMETVRAREYRVKIEKFKGFETVQLLQGQPYLDKTFDWGIVERK